MLSYLIGYRAALFDFFLYYLLLLLPLTPSAEPQSQIQALLSRHIHKQKKLIPFIQLPSHFHVSSSFRSDIRGIQFSLLFSLIIYILKYLLFYLAQSNDPPGLTKYTACILKCRAEMRVQQNAARRGRVQGAAGEDEPCCGNGVSCIRTLEIIFSFGCIQQTLAGLRRLRHEN